MGEVEKKLLEHIKRHLSRKDLSIDDLYHLIKVVDAYKSLRVNNTSRVWLLVWLCLVTLTFAAFA